MTFNTNRLVGKRIADRYCITGRIGKGGMGVVFQAIPFDDPSEYTAIKVIHRDGALGSDDLLRFQKEAALMSQLYHPNIIYFHELGLFDDPVGGVGSGYYIVMEVANGLNLKDILQRDGRKDLPFFFQLGLQVSDALSYTHAKSIVHRDIKPGNIIVGDAWRDKRGIMVKVLDFGVARLADAIHTGPKGARRGFEDYAGTPLYMAPEQTGLIDATSDHRVDLYSLGCVLYEILAGKPPFTAPTREKLERAHCFANLEPLAAVRPDIPPMVEEIVHKLLAKHPDQRYQTAFGLHADLIRAKARYEARGRKTTSFPLGLKDKFQSVSAHIPMAGRQPALDRLVAGYQAVSTEKGRAHMAVVSGGPGIGKSRLLGEFRGWLSERRSRYIGCSFSQHENSLDFNALANAFNEYLHKVYKTLPNEAEEIRMKVKTNLGPAAHWIAEVVPGLKPFISDEIEEPTHAGGNYDSPAFVKAFSDFTRCLAAENQPLVFMIDNLHWADEKSLKLIDEFFSQGNSQRFYLVVSHRPVADMTKARFGAFIQKFRPLKRRFIEVGLESLPAEAVSEVVRSMLNGSIADVDGLTAHLMEVTAGLPMHVVELVRALVASDLICFDEGASTWTYDIDAIRANPIQIDSIDLVLTRIQSYNEEDRRILEVAATAGMTFQFELLLIEGRSQAVAVMQSLERAVADGLITRVQEEKDLKHLGKAFAFTHKKARDTMYEHISVERRRLLHEMVGTRMEILITETTPKSTFALAHHFTSALMEGKTSSSELARRAMKYNIAAGHAAWGSQSWMSAERYFENAFIVMSDWGERLASNADRAKIMEQLADLAALQHRVPEAIEKIRSVLKIPLSRQHHAMIAVKAISYQTQAGVVSDSIRLAQKTITSIGGEVPRGGFGDWARFAWGIARDVFPRDLRRGRMFDALRRAFQIASTRKGDDPAADGCLSLYEAGGVLMLRHNPVMAALFHDYAVRSMNRKGVTPEELIRTVGVRAALLGYMGFVSTGYRLFDLAMELATRVKLNRVTGQLALLRAQTLDYMKNRPDELADDIDKAESFLKESNDRVFVAEALVFRAFRSLQRGEIPDMFKDLDQVPELVSNRSWIMARAVSLTLFAHLLQGSRDIIVRKGESFLNRRRMAQGRVNDQFSMIVQALVAFARGEADRTRQYYMMSMDRFISGNGVEFLLPFEEDFVGLFAFVFPVLFEQEQGRKLMRDAEMRVLLSRMHRRVRSIRGNTRSTPSLLLARCRELLGKRGVKKLYDHATQSSLMTGNTLAQFFAQVWFGLYLIHSGQPEKREYIRRALQQARGRHMKGLIDYAEKLIDKHGGRDRSEAISSQPLEAKGRVRAMHSDLVLGNLRRVSEVAGAASSLEDDITQMFGTVWTEAYGGSSVMAFVVGAGDSSLRRVYGDGSTRKESDVAEYAAPYLNIRSTLFLPANDAPWVNPGSKRRGSASLSTNTVAGTLAGAAVDGTVEADRNAAAAATSMASTLILDNAGTDVAATQVLDSAVKSPGAPEEPSAIDRPASVQLNAIVPMRVSTGNVGFLFIENVDMQGRDSAQCRHELDALGAQIGILAARKVGGGVATAEDGAASVPVERPVYRPGKYVLEGVSWLRLWHRGALRETRETVWYEGLAFGENHYLLVFCHMSGPAEVRESLGAMIWYHLRVLRALAGATGRLAVDVAEIREELAGLLATTPRVNQLQHVGIAFTVFDRESRVCSSGHFGNARPVVLGTDNHVTPSNDVVVRMSSGQDLRYWEVVSSMDGPHVYVLSSDTSRLEVNMAMTARGRLQAGFDPASREADGQRLLDQIVMPENLPRYYVAGLMLAGSGLSGTDQGKTKTRAKS